MWCFRRGRGQEHETLKQAEDGQYIYSRTQRDAEGMVTFHHARYVTPDEATRLQLQLPAEPRTKEAPVE